MSLQSRIEAQENRVTIAQKSYAQSERRNQSRSKRTKKSRARMMYAEAVLIELKQYGRLQQ